ncbi:class I SAM-dependent methyltransferase [Streptomyces hesseae]|uniref:Class I SAM-dependent methyltransferase n=1 Tax=Streptomyces hesseae TaxID=3075519 RepID=A0ABU2SM14_9ACTN|nr:class I SAM-dependent methyltransferase [Streptomyces sp. DSM 40473]MDT0449090.1 class I SAM-dependent methyltransferase [Streptomyces sp. DSM 40473]
MSVTERYLNAWEGYWGASSGAPGEAIWDSEPETAAEAHPALLALPGELPLPVVDLGCGNGTRTRWLAGHFPRAIGVDLSWAAVEHARRADPEGLAAYERLDLVDTAAVRALHERLGDSHVYLRAVIHQSDPEDRPAVAAAVAELVGARGRAFVVELEPAAKDVIAEAAGASGGTAEKFRRVFEHDLRPAAASGGEVAGLLRGAGLAIRAEGATELAMTGFHADGRRILLPAHWFVVGRAGAPAEGDG